MSTALELVTGRKPRKKAAPQVEPVTHEYEAGGRVRWQSKGTEYHGRIKRVLCNCLIVEIEELPPLEREIGCWFAQPDTKVLEYEGPIEYAE